MRIDWTKRDGMHVAEIGNITLAATPAQWAKGFIPKAARGSKWRAQCSIWDDATSTMSRYGRDEYMTLYGTAAEAKRAAERIYTDATA